MSKFDARKAAHDAARRASENGSCNVLACAFDGRENRVCSIYCDEQVAAFERAHRSGQEETREEVERLRAALETARDLLREHIGETRLREGCDGAGTGRPCACCRSIVFVEGPLARALAASSPLVGGDAVVPPREGASLLGTEYICAGCAREARHGRRYAGRGNKGPCATCGKLTSFFAHPARPRMAPSALREVADAVVPPGGKTP